MTKLRLPGFGVVEQLHQPQDRQLELFEFALGIALVGGLFWLLYHLEMDWPERLLSDRGFRDEVLAVVFAVALAWYLIPFFV